ncbi:DNA mismatch repair endonuclease MutL, partial [Acidobacteriota bacterium]
MNRIKVLPSEISVKIAAGEVIERPGSVVKELVENSLDAGATEISVELLDGGKGLIRVTDNGHGMEPQDAETCFMRHSTSKIDGEEDLNRISTLGFRGEALPSISAVSRITLRTNTEGSDRGIEVRREGEDVLGVSEIAFPKGTSFEVKDLFFNLPARKKFLRSERSELTFTAKYLTNAALANPEVRFSLKHGRREIFSYPAVSSLKERLFQVYGKASVDCLMEVDYRDREYHLFGYVSVPPNGRSDRTRQMFYVNKRPVKDKTLQAAFNQAYRGFLEKDRFAEAYLFLSVPYSDVDVNVHPTKAEVRFQESRSLFQFIYKSIHHSILSEKGIKEVYSSSREQVHSPHEIKERPYSRGFQFSPADLLEGGQGDLPSDTPTLFPAEGEEQGG